MGYFEKMILTLFPQYVKHVALHFLHLLLLHSRPCWIFSPVSKAKFAVCRSVSVCPQSFLWASTGLDHVQHLKVSKVGQNCRMWLGFWGPVPHGHSSEWEIFSLWRWERSWQCALSTYHLCLMLSKTFADFVTSTWRGTRCSASLSWSAWRGAWWLTKETPPSV